MEILLKLVLDAFISLPLALITVLIANGMFQQHWDYLPVYVAWFMVLFIGIVFFSVDGGDFDLF